LKPLADRVALVAGATRGAGRGIAGMLGEAGATVYCTGRSTRASGPPTAGPYTGRPETIEDTAAMVSARGGRGHWAKVDHANAGEVGALIDRVRDEAGRLDILVIDFWGDYHPVAFGTPFWNLPLDAGRATIDSTLWPHVITLQAAVPLMLETRHKPGLIVEVAEGPELTYRSSFFYDLAAMLRIRIAYAVAEELAAEQIAAVAITPGYMRSETTLDGFGVTEANWRDAIARDPNFAASETPFYAGRAVAALAGDPDVLSRSGRLFGSWQIAEDYGFTDIDGSRPNLGRHFAETFGESPVPLNTDVRWRITTASLARTS
jgi:NAD(P)-dependent dehydrogenase (short-subunit alcohol dehydrogenase family)